MKEYIFEPVSVRNEFIQFRDIMISDYVTYNFFIKFLRPKDNLFKTRSVNYVLADSYFRHIVELVNNAEEDDRYYCFKVY